MTTQLQPLAWNTAIVNKDGTPTVQFMRFLQAHNLLIGDATDELAVLDAAQIHVTTPITGGGLLKSSPTIGFANSGVVAGTYGDATHVGQFTVDIHGIVSSATNVPISIPSALEVDHNGTMVLTNVSNLNFTGSNITVSSPSAGHVDVAVTASPTLEVDNAGGTVATAVNFLKFTGAYVTVTNPSANHALVDITVPTHIWAPAVTGVLPGPTLVAGPAGECIMVMIV